MPQKLARQAFVNPRPISRPHWQPSRVRGSTRPIRLLLQLAGIQWEGKTDERLLIDVVPGLLTVEVFITPTSLKSVQSPFLCSHNSRN